MSILQMGNHPLRSQIIQSSIRRIGSAAIVRIEQLNQGYPMHEADFATIETLPIQATGSSAVVSATTIDQDSFFSINCYRNHKLWIAWVDSMPDVMGGGDEPSEAIANLLVMFNDHAETATIAE